jgi:hypothetical protein
MNYDFNTQNFIYETTLVNQFFSLGIEVRPAGFDVLLASIPFTLRK